MNRLPLPVLLMLALYVAIAARAAPPLVESRYGEAAPFLAGTLKYPDFTVRYAAKSEQSRPDLPGPWENYVFEVLDTEGKTIGGEIRFSTEERANGRRFDVRGRIYLAEFFHTTATEANTPATGPRNLPRDMIVVWDEAAARRGNPRLAPIWDREKIDPKARYSSQNAYADGELLVDFTATTELETMGAVSGHSGYRVRAVPLVTWKDPRSVQPKVTTAYGQRVSLRSGGIRFPDFVAQCTDINVSNPAEPGRSATMYNFTVFNSAGENGGFRFDSGSMANGGCFELGGKRYFAEMFATTALDGTMSPEETARRLTPLRPDEIIVWDESTAGARNPAIIAAWQATALAGGRFAAGAPLGTMFTGTYLLGDLGDWSRRDELDRSLIPDHREPVRFPEALAGTGFVASVGGSLWVNADGTVDRVLVTHGNDSLFQKPAAEALRRWTFQPPMREGRPVKAFVSFRWKIAEPEMASGLEFN